MNEKMSLELHDELKGPRYLRPVDRPSLTEKVLLDEMDPGDWDEEELQFYRDAWF